jgi:hypothetical protein
MQLCRRDGGFHKHGRDVRALARRQDGATMEAYGRRALGVAGGDGAADAGSEADASCCVEQVVWTTVALLQYPPKTVVASTDSHSSTFVSMVGRCSRSRHGSRGGIKNRVRAPKTHM